MGGNRRAPGPPPETPVREGNQMSGSSSGCRDAVFLHGELSPRARLLGVRCERGCAQGSALGCGFGVRTSSGMAGGVRVLSLSSRVTYSVNFKTRFKSSSFLSGQGRG
ncbi:unnamed protein product [Coccothraustes coccothraustes]